MRLYHGTKAKFNKFSMDFLGTNGYLEGLGLYFTDSKEIASSYAYDNGRIFTIEFEGKKPLNSTEISLSKKEIRTLLLELHKRRNVLNDYDDVYYYGVDKVLESTIDMLIEENENDVDLVCELANTSGSHKDVLDIVYNTLGYDHCVTEAEWGRDRGQEVIYTIFAPDIFEIIDIEDYK